MEGVKGRGVDQLKELTTFCRLGYFRSVSVFLLDIELPT